MFNFRFALVLFLVPDPVGNRNDDENTKHMPVRELTMASFLKSKTAPAPREVRGRADRFAH